MKSTRHYQPIENILKSSKQQLAELMHKVNQLRELNQCFHANLDKKLANHCQICQFEKGKLKIVADSAAWATKIRYMAPQLIPQLSKQKMFHGLTDIQCMIRPTPASDINKRKPRDRVSLSNENAELIQETAQRMPEKLRSALLRLTED